MSVQKQTPELTDAQSHVLQVLQDTELILTPSIIAQNAWFTRQTAQRALNDLRLYGKVKKVKRGHYVAKEK